MKNLKTKKKRPIRNLIFTIGLWVRLNGWQTGILFIIYFMVIQCLPPLMLYLFGYWELATSYLAIVNFLSPFPIPIIPVCIALSISTRTIINKIKNKKLYK